MNTIDWSIPFLCLPPNNENEWINLSDFTDFYNSIYGKNYTLRSFPENDNRNSPEPEVLLCDGDSKMVIERKGFPFPLNHIREHQLWHEFNQELFEKLTDTFSDGLYLLEITDVDMPKNRKEMLKLIDAITSNIFKYESEIKLSDGIYEDGLIPWSFFRASEIEQEDAPKDCCIGVRLRKTSSFYNKKQIDESITIVKSRLSKIIESVSLKFDNYDDCIKILILEPHTHIRNFLSDIFKPSMQSLKTINNIDQVWLAVQYEISDFEFELDYQLIKDSQ